MAESAQNDRPSVAMSVPRCRHLRTNGMYIFDGDEHPEGTDADEYESSGAWCQRTMKSYGPDDDLVGRRECRDSSRPCYEPL